ncbi:MAG TPA: response regulator transcription factor [Chthoniobacteraceae bacterium]|jgi:DNA-binding NarL/FixJ family response regulator
MTRILIIEDEPQMRRSLATALTMEGFEALTAENGRVGVEMARRELPDLILCDVMMPELDGYGVLSELRGDADFATTPFLFLTAKGEKTDLRFGMNSGADDYLTKPVDIDDLLAAIQSRITRRDHQRSALAAALQSGPNFDSPQPLEEALGLTPRESEVLLWAAQGKGNGDIAAILGAGESTIKKHLQHIFEKLGVENRGAAALAAIEVLSRLQAR